nr:hypothetical protein HUO10_003336 [Paraburkholderia busanensis]
MNSPQTAGFRVRLEPEVKEKLEDAAKRNFRSLNMEINARLVASLKNEKENAPAAGTDEAL